MRLKQFETIAAVIELVSPSESLIFVLTEEHQVEHSSCSLVDISSFSTKFVGFFFLPGQISVDLDEEILLIPSYFRELYLLRPIGRQGIGL